MAKRRRAARTVIRRTRRAATRAVRRGKTSRIGGVSPKGAIGVSLIRKIPIFNSLPPQYRQSAQMISLGVGGKAIGVGGMQHFTATGIAYGIANFMETSNMLGGILGGNTQTTVAQRQTV